MEMITSKNSVQRTQKERSVNEVLAVVKTKTPLELKQESFKKRYNLN